MQEFDGFVDDIRNLGGIAFIKLNTATGYRQVTINKKLASKELLDSLSRLTRQSCIRVFGSERPDPTTKGRMEIVPTSIEILSISGEPLPLDPSGKTPALLDTRLEWRALDLRNQRNKDIFKVESKIIEGMAEYFRKNGFVQVFTPSLMGTPAESGSDVFAVNYYGKNAFLRQDPQLHRELTIIGGMDKIFEIGPSWRAEVSHTVRHLSEHRTCAAEIAYINDEKDVIRLESEMALSMFSLVKDACKDELERFGVELEVPKLPIPVLNFPEVYDIIEEMGGTVKRGEDYDKAGEDLLGKYVKEKFKTDFFFVDKFPFSAKPFYVMRFDDEPEWARSIDFIYKGMEMSSGGQREHRYEKLIEQIRIKGMSQSNLEWFTRFFKYGAPTMGGFSIGIERLTMQILNLDNVREAALFPRDPERMTP
ncbi:MAG: aspartate--tRNA(Asn) ligase [Candidatus Micrarchaeaceae archaeon]